MPPRLLLLLLDFDGTLTTHDTTATLASLAYIHPSSPPLPPWSYFTRAYLDDLEAYDRDYRVKRGRERMEGGKWAEGRKWEEEVRYLRGLRGVERRSVERLEGAGVFRGVRRGEVEGGEVELRRGWGRVVGLEGGVEVGVVSVSWSREWVRGVLRAGLTKEAEVGEGGKKEEMGRRVEELGIVANEFSFDGVGGMGRYWGRGEGGIWTSEDKARVLREVHGVGGDGDGRVSVYVGDSATDLEALMLVDVGIVIRDEEMGSSQLGLKQLVERVGVECRWIGEFGREWEGKRALWWARDFDDVCDSPLLSTLRDGALKP